MVVFLQVLSIIKKLKWETGLIIIDIKSQYIKKSLIHLNTKTTKNSKMSSPQSSVSKSSKASPRLSGAELDAAIKKNSNTMTGVSLCIPRVFKNIGFRRIKRAIIACQWGFVERVDVVPAGKFKRAFIHFAPGKWNNRSAEARDVLAALQSGQQVKVVYDDPWFWLIGVSHVAKPAEAPKPPPRPTVQIIAKAVKSVDEKTEVADILAEMSESVDKSVAANTLVEMSGTDSVPSNC
jgi:hypothetical protein